MSLRSRIEKLERSLGRPDEPPPMPFLTRPEMAVAIAIRAKWPWASKRGSNPRPSSEGVQQMTPEERQKHIALIRQQVERAREIEAAGKLPEVLASLRAKGFDVGP